MSSGYNHNNPNSSTGQQQQQQGPPPPPLNMSGGDHQLYTGSPEESSAVDHALLESLFYNEMMMLDTTSPSSSNILSQHFAGAVQSPPTHQPSTSTTNHPHPHPAETDARTIAEKEMLQDFGVTANSQVHSFHSPLRSTTTSSRSSNADHHQQHQPTASYYAGPSAVNAQPVSTTTTQITQRVPPSPIPQYKYTTTAATTHNAFSQQTHPHTNTPLYPAPVPPPAETAAAASVVVPPTGHPSSVHPFPSNEQLPTSSSQTGLPSQQPLPPPEQQVRTTRSQQPIKTHTPALTIDTKKIPSNNENGPGFPPAEEEKSQKLVDQFTTLASRLGIELPDNVLQSLTAVAAMNDGHDAAEIMAITNSTMNNTTTKLKGVVPAESTSATTAGGDEKQRQKINITSSEKLLVEVAPTVEEMRKTAEEAIAAVTKKRPASDDGGSGDNSDTAGGGGTATTAMKGGEGAAAAAARPLYSKRRKKPRLQDCETRLAELQKENELLKRHLKNVSSKAIRFDQEKEEAGKLIKKLHDTNAGPEKMDEALKNFSDMYSDYGINRQQELSFHLEQLQRLVNPTNFTKLGLWTLGRDSSDPKGNPIAGILMNELEILPQQGRKIVEQSDKIRKLCENLKESLVLLAKLRSLCEQKTQIFHDRMNKCREILTSKQVAKLVIWIDDHTQLLEAVCPGWGTEHIHSHSKPQQHQQQPVSSSSS